VNIYFDSKAGDDNRRKGIFEGSLYVHAPSPGALKLCGLAQDLIQEALGPLDPATAHEHMPPEKFAEILSVLKPKFIHHPSAKLYLQEMLADLGCDLSKTYFDVPRLRTAFPGDYLKSGIAYAFHPHRDTWYSAPFSQVNFWMPVYDISANNCMALHPHYWDRAIKNGSSEYNYYKWNLESRQSAGQHVKTDTRVQPRPEEPIELEPHVRPVCEIGGVYLFSAAHLHSTVPNTTNATRYSIDFRAVHLDDVLNRVGAPNVDSACTGTTMGDYLRGTDLSHLPAEAMALYTDGTESLYRAEKQLAPAR
jgi:Phytanoyl-CoA dioxygenase (PhyH)